MNVKWTVLAVPVVVAAVAFAFTTQPVSSQLSAFGPGRAVDPGVRDPQGPAGAGGPIAGLTDAQLEFFNQGRADFSIAEGERRVRNGLGPRMNLDSCEGCHAQPTIGGTSPAVNPQVAFATKQGGTDSVPPFVFLDGPVREARFIRNPDGTPDGGVHALFTITDWFGSGDCRLAQPNFAAEMEKKNVIFRIPTPVFGAGLIEQITDVTILANQEANAGQKQALGIRGRPNFTISGRTSGEVNRNGNDGTITRFGWKAQNVSLLLFSGEAFNVEMGITNELFQNERDQSTLACRNIPNVSVPNDIAESTLQGTTAIQNFANFQRFLAPPMPSADTPGGAESIGRGRNLFSSTGCALCHTPALQTNDQSAVEALRNKPVNLYSDLLLHDMGIGLSDGVSQGSAGPREFRTAPLWGLGKRIFFLHDGRTRDLVEAIQEHRSFLSEANGVVRNFNMLRENDKQDLLNFLRSL